MLISLLLVLAICIDAFATSVTYGIAKIKIPVLSAIIVSLIGSSFLAISLFFANFISKYIQINVCTIVSGMLLLFLGVSNLFNNYIKGYLRKNKGIKNMKFSISDISVMIDIILDESNADFDNSKIISIREALVLSIALSLDSLATGFSFGLNYNKVYTVFLLSFIIGLVSVISGNIIGQKISRVSKVDLSWLCGLLLIILAIICLA